MTMMLERLKFTVDDYYKLVDAGILQEGSRVELIEGDIITMSPKGIVHNQLANRLMLALVNQLQGNYIVAVENTIRLSDTSAPEPDLAVLDLKTDEENAPLPTAADVYLIIEVSRSTLEYDHTIKLPLYARASIREVWIVNAEDKSIEQYTQPTVDGYTEMKVYRGREKVTSPYLPLEVVVKNILR
jgi:Uma2 family endonuclease